MDPWLQIALGLATLIAGAELMVRGAVWAALQLGVGKMMVGLTLVAFGTSAPELVVCLRASLDGNTDTAVGTVLGSNLANIGLIVGLSAAVQPITVVGGRIVFESRYLLVTTFLTVPPFIAGIGIGRPLAGAMLAVLALFMSHLIYRERALRNERRARDPRAHPPPPRPTVLLLNLAFLAAGAVGLMYGGEWLPEGAARVADRWGMPQYLISMILIGVGTSLPELATSVTAALRGHPEICLGNVVGSNIFNVGMVLGITGLVRPLPVPADALPSMLAGLVAALALVLTMRSAGRVPRPAGILMLAGYLLFMAWEVARSR